MHAHWLGVFVAVLGCLLPGVPAPSIPRQEEGREGDGLAGAIAGSERFSGIDGSSYIRVLKIGEWKDFTPGASAPNSEPDARVQTEGPEKQEDAPRAAAESDPGFRIAGAGPPSSKPKNVAPPAPVDETLPPPDPISRPTAVPAGPPSENPQTSSSWIRDVIIPRDPRNSTFLLSRCSPNPCGDHGTCRASENPDGRFMYCWCRKPYGGRFCEIENPCAANKCPENSVRCQRAAFKNIKGRFCFDASGDVIQEEGVSPEHGKPAP